MFRRLSRWASAAGIIVTSVGLVQAQGDSDVGRSIHHYRRPLFDSGDDVFEHEFDQA